MKRWKKCLLLVTLLVAAFPYRSPAPIVFRAGEGWVWEPVGGESWMRERATEQMEVAQQAYDRKDYNLAAKAARRVVTKWPLSDYSPQAAYLLARSHEELKEDELAFKEYQALLQKYPKAANYEEVMRRQFEICNRFLSGQKFKLWGLIPTMPSMDKTVAMYERLIKSGPYSDVAAQAQLNIGAAREKQTRFLNDNEPFVQAAKAYELAADRYHDRPTVAAEALFREGLAYEKQARTAEYDQSTAGQAINAFSDFKSSFPGDSRVKEADRLIAALKDEQARGNFEVARYYETKGQWKSAVIYYNEVVSKNPESPYKDSSMERIASLKKLIETASK